MGLGYSGYVPQGNTIAKCPPNPARATYQGQHMAIDGHSLTSAVGLPLDISPRKPPASVPAGSAATLLAQVLVKRLYGDSWTGSSE
jgi:hypothetical protein